MKKLLALLLAALMVLSLAACSMEGGSSEPAKTEETTAAPETTETETEQPAEETAAPEVKADADITIAVVPKSLDNAIFLDSQAAAEAKAKELGINLQWVGPTTSDAGQQVTVIEGLIEKQVDGILISCNDADALKDVIDRAVDAGIVVLSDSHVLMSGTPREVFARGDELMTAGLDVPQVTRVAMALRDKGIAINPAVYTVDELSKELVALKRGGGKKC